MLKMGPYFKIGISSNVQNRIKRLTATALPYETSLVCLIKFDTKGPALKLENSLHKRFADKRMNGEWFRLSPDDIEYIKSLAKE